MRNGDARMPCPKKRKSPADRHAVAEANRRALVEANYRWAQDLAHRIARRMQIRDVDNAVGEALVALIGAVQAWDGERSFRAFAAVCIRRRMIDCRRRERREVRAESIDDDERGECLAAQLASHPSIAECEVRRRIAGNDRQAAAIIVMRFCLGWTGHEIGEALRIPPSRVRQITREALMVMGKG